MNIKQSSLTSCVHYPVRVAVRYVLCCHAHVTPCHIVTRARVTEMANIEQLCNIRSQTRDNRDMNNLDTSKLHLQEYCVKFLSETLAQVASDYTSLKSAQLRL